MSALEVDAVVVGGGPAGLAAASWLGRYRRSVVVMDSGDYRNASTGAGPRCRLTDTAHAKAPAPTVRGAFDGAD